MERKREGRGRERDCKDFSGRNAISNWIHPVFWYEKIA
jgi:hypothetical protein